MKFIFFDKDNELIAYEPSNNEISTIQKGKKNIVTMKNNFWENIARLGGVVDDPANCGVVIQPTADNYQTIAVKHSVISKDGLTFVGYGSSNAFSTSKFESVYTDYKTKKETVNVSGSICYATEMAVKRAKKTAIALALGLPHNEVANDVVFSSFCLKKNITPASIKHQLGMSKIGAVSSNEQEQEQIPPVQQPMSSTQQKPSQNKTLQDSSTNNKYDLENPESYVMPSGKYRGRTLLDLLHANKSARGYITWALDNPDKFKNTEALAYMKALVKKYSSFFDMDDNSNKPIEKAGVPPKKQLFDAWTNRGYKLDTDEDKQIVRTAIANALNIPEADRPNFSWENVSEKQAESIIDKIDIVFPKIDRSLKTQVTSNNAQSVESMSGFTCADCGKELQKFAVDFCRENNIGAPGVYYCVQHQSEHLAE